ncbi:MAG: hypothetical protein GC205_01770 [Bacteroidetes bacterium]|nr:hypothetical protein [Bacteroidota bacterium]
MKAYQANLLNAIVLILVGLWGYLSEATADRSPTALIPVAFGVILLAMTSGVRKENKVIAHVAVTLTLLVLVMLAAMPLPARIAAGDQMGIFRIILMISASTHAMICFVQSFIAARKARQ